MKIQLKKFSPDARIEKAHNSDFCYDCYAVSEEEVAPNVWRYGLGFGLQKAEPLPDEFRLAFNFRARSSVWETGMVLSNGQGTIDQGYTGEISMVFYHVLPLMPRYKVGDKVCQFCIEETSTMEFDLVGEFTPTDRGDNGYGSSDKKEERL